MTDTLTSNLTRNNFAKRLTKRLNSFPMYGTLWMDRRSTNLCRFRVDSALQDTWLVAVRSGPD